jgi:hypothetical protein
MVRLAFASCGPNRLLHAFFFFFLPPPPLWFATFHQFISPFPTCLSSSSCPWGRSFSLVVFFSFLLISPTPPPACAVFTEQMNLMNFLPHPPPPVQTV